MNRLLIVAVTAMLVQQAFAYLATLVLPTLAPAISDALGFSIARVGDYISIMYVASFFSALAAGGIIARFGALRSSQAALVLIAAGLLLATGGSLWLFALSAIVIGLGSAMSTPASSQILSRHASARAAPLAFAIKQTGVPLGGWCVGLLMPFVAGLWDWRAGFVTAAAICALLALALQPVRARFDDDRDPNAPISLRGLFTTLGTVLREQRFRLFALGALTWIGLQALFGAFFVSYLVRGLGTSLAEAGFIFGTAQAVSIPARIFWGWLAGGRVPARLLRAVLCIGMLVSSLLLALFTPDWPVAAIYAVAIAFSATAISWHGVFLAEVARIAPPGQVATVTGGVLAMGGFGFIFYPKLYSLLLEQTGRYDVGFALAALPVVLVAAALLRRPRVSRRQD